MAFWQRRTASLIQYDPSECGIVALAIVLAFFGRSNEIDLLRQELDPSRDGISALAIVEACRRRGLEVKASRCEAIRLRTFRPPMIALLRNKHFVVIERCSEQLYWLNDPARGRYKVAAAVFQQQFEGLTLTFDASAISSGDNKVKSEDRVTLGTGALVAMALLLSVVSSLTPFAIGVALPVLPRLRIPEILLAAIGLGGLVGGLTLMQHQLRGSYQVRIATGAVMTYLRRLLRTNAKASGLLTASDLVRRSELFSKVALFRARTFPDGLAAVTQLLAIDTLACLLNVRIGMLLLCINSFQVIVQLLTGRYDSGVSKSFAKRSQLITETTTILLRSRMDIVLSSASDQVVGRCQELLRTDYAGWRSQLTKDAFQTLLPPLITGAAGLVVFLLSLSEFHSNRLSVSGFLSVQGLAAFSAIPASQASMFFRGRQRVTIEKGELAATVGRIHSPSHRSIQPAKTFCNPETLIQLNGVSFRYNSGGPLILDDVTAAFRTDRSYSLQAPSGSGKSTLARLIAGYEAPSSGRVLRRGSTDLVNWRPCMLGKDLAIFPGTLADNVRLWNRTIHDETLLVILSRVGFDPLQARELLPMHHSVLRKTLSGGEQQRLSFARALCLPSPFLIIDEATSALDVTSEKQLLRILQEEQRSFLLISHRVEALDLCDEHFRLDRGMLYADAASSRLDTIKPILARP